VYCGLYGINFETVALDQMFRIQLGQYLKPNGGIIFPNPNAPTGCPVALADIEKLLIANTESVVVVDEAYVDFGCESAVSLVNRYPQLLVVHTLSKARSLAGLRVGYAVGNATLIEGLNRVKDSFNSYPLDRVAQAGAVAAVEDHQHFETTRQQVINSRLRLVAELQQLGFEVLPSVANFIMAKHPGHDGAALTAALRERSIIVRHFKNPTRIAPFLRITVGTDAQCDALLSALREILR